MKQFLVRCSVFGALILVFLFLLLRTTNYQLPTTNAQTSGCGSPQGSEIARVSGGLVTAPQLGSGTQFYTSEGKCILDSITVFRPYEVPDYEKLKSLYFTQVPGAAVTKTTVTPSTSPGANQANIPFNSATGYNLYNIVGSFNNLVLGGNNLGAGNGVVFVDGYLNITSNYSYGGPNSGAVFVVSGNIYIESDVTQIDAVLISGGRIYTATSVGTINPCGESSVNVPKLTVNGSLISLTASSPIVFCRTLTSINNAEAAEVINHQPKYLVLLRNTLSQTLQKWTEINETVILPSAPPASTPAPTPAPTPTSQPATQKRVFVTSTTHTGNLGGLAGADSICQTRASTLGGTWKAWLSSSTISASSRLTHSTVPYKLVDAANTMIANDWTDLTDGSLINSINKTEDGSIASSGTIGVWTNTNTTGAVTSTTLTCNNWINNLSSDSAFIGRFDMATASWTLFAGGTGPSGTYSCNTAFRLYCFEQ